MLSQKGRRKRIGLLMETCQGGGFKNLQFCVADNYWILSHSKTHLEQMMKDLTGEADRWDVEPKPASLWWTNTYDDEKMDDKKIWTTTGLHKLPFEKKKFWILGYAFNQAGRTQDSLKDRTQSANKAWWRDAKIYRSKDVPWRVKCKRMVEHVWCILLWKRELVLESSHRGQD